VPTTIVSFAEAARLHEGFRLIMRCLRHAIDPQAFSLIYATGYIVLYEEQPALLLHHRVKASMKDQLYEVSVCFTEKTIISCQCSCKIGAMELERVMCVHVLPVIYQMTLMLFDGLADSCLIELANDWKNIEANGMTTTLKKEIKEYLLQLVTATRHYDISDDEKEVADILKIILVGTEQAKKPTPPPKDPNLVGPLTELDLSSVEKQAERRINNNKINQNESSSTNEQNIENIQQIRTMTTETYQDIVRGIAAFKSWYRHCRTKQVIV
jgi:hypothetical protein